MFTFKNLRGIIRRVQFPAVLVLLFSVGCATPSDTARTTVPGAAPSPTIARLASAVPSSAPNIPPAAPSTVPTSRPLAPSAVPTANPPVPGTLSSAAPTLDTNNWTTYHRDNQRAGYIRDLPDPTRLAVAWQADLDGAVYAEPLVVDGHVIAATEANSVYSLNASTGQVEWRTNLGAPVSRSELPCGNIDPLGITGTPVYDPQTGLVFAVAETSGPAHILFGLDAKNGQVKLRRPVNPPGMEPRVHQQRAALLLSQGTVYIAFGGLFGDCGNYHGMVLGSRTDGSGDLLVFQVPTPREGGIWAPPGPVADANGRIFVSVGNGSETSGAWDHTDSVLRLSAALKLEDGFAPQEWQQDNARDADLGSFGPVLLPGNLIFIAGKTGTGYVLHADSLGGVGGQILEQPVCHAYGGAAVAGSSAYLACTEGLQKITVGSEPSITIGWRGPAPGTPVVGGQTVYNLDRNGTLYALDAGTGKERAKVSLGAATTRFAAPTLYKDQVFVGTTSGIVAVTASH